MELSKSEFRAQVRGEIRALDAGYISQSDVGIIENVVAMPEFAAAGKVFAYHAMGRECATQGIIDRALAMGKTVALPRSRPGGVMDFASCEQGLHKAMYGIMEPDASAPALTPELGDIVIVPAVCCDRRGMRLGQGGGYYDRFLAGYPGVCTVCLCRERLLKEIVPVEWNDSGVDFVITEAEAIKCPRVPPVVLRDGSGRGELMRELISEYAISLGRDIGFQHPERELADPELVYGPPGGAAIVAMRGAKAAGMVALRRLTDARCEMKRLYVRPAFRSLRLGEALARGIAARAAELGYSEMVIDTLGDMRAARHIYERLGFRECEPYYANPLPDAAFMRLTLGK